MDLEAIGGGGLSGFITAVFTLLGWNRRLTNVERSKQEKEFCKVTHDSVTSDLKYIRDRLDKLFDFEMERRRNSK